MGPFTINLGNLSKQSSKTPGIPQNLDLFFFVNPLTPVPLVTGRDKHGLSSTSDVIAFDQNWHHLYPTSAGGKDLSNEFQIRVIGLMAPEICTKMLKKLSEKLRAKFPASTPGSSKVKITRLNDAFLEVFLTTENG